jgi:peptidoglycan/LPS O-acetylase OafA/YrhL
MVGVLSYSLYLWQQPFLNRESNSSLCAFPLNIVLVSVMAVLSYLLVERPFLRLRHTLELTHARAHAPSVSVLAR